LVSLFNIFTSLFIIKKIRLRLVSFFIDICVYTDFVKLLGMQRNIITSFVANKTKKAGQKKIEKLHNFLGKALIDN